MSRKQAAETALCNLTEMIELEAPESVAAIIIAPMSGSNTGYQVPTERFMTGVREFCDRHGILLIFDDIQVGFARTGKWFCCEHWGVTPDIMTVGKGFSGGYLPLSGVITTPAIADAFSQPGAELRTASR